MMRLFGFGQPIVSDIAISGALAWGGIESGLPQLSIRTGQAREAVAGPIYRLEGETLVFSPPGVAEYRCSPTEIEILPHPSSVTEDIEALLIATALPAVQWMQGHFMLHAAAVLLPGHDSAIAIAGISGSGKSTIAAELLARGGRLVGDDSIRIVAKDGKWNAAGLAGGLFKSDLFSPHRQFVAAPPAASLYQATIGAVFILSERGKESAIHRLDAPTAVGRLIAMQHRPAIPAILGQQQQMLDIAAGIAKTLPVYAWERREGIVALEDSEWEFLQSCSNKG